MSDAPRKQFHARCGENVAILGKNHGSTANYDRPIQMQVYAYGGSGDAAVTTLVSVSPAMAREIAAALVAAADDAEGAVS